jgi:hypothetical protein
MVYCKNAILVLGHEGAGSFVSMYSLSSVSDNNIVMWLCNLRV